MEQNPAYEQSLTNILNYATNREIPGPEQLCADAAIVGTHSPGAIRKEITMLLFKICAPLGSATRTEEPFRTVVYLLNEDLFKYLADKYHRIILDGMETRAGRHYEPKDILQEYLANGYLTTLKNYDPMVSAFSTYVGTSIQRITYGLFEEEGRIPSQTMFNSEGNPIDINDGRPGPVAQLTAREFAEKLSVAISRHRAVQMRLVEGEEWNTIALRLGISRSRVDTEFRRGTEDLKARFPEYGR